jgi:hypothetical protein
MSIPSKPVLKKLKLTTENISTTKLQPISLAANKTQTKLEVFIKPQQTNMCIEKENSTLSTSSSNRKRKSNDIEKTPDVLIIENTNIAFMEISTSKFENAENPNTLILKL